MRAEKSLMGIHHAIHYFDRGREGLDEPYHYINTHSPSLSFVRSGQVNLFRGSARRFALSSYGWASSAIKSTSTNSGNVYGLYFDAVEVSPTGSPSHRWYGHPIRCQTQSKSV